MLNFAFRVERGVVIFDVHLLKSGAGAGKRWAGWIILVSGYDIFHIEK